LGRGAGRLLHGGGRRGGGGGRGRCAAGGDGRMVGVSCFVSRTEQRNSEWCQPAGVGPLEKTHFFRPTISLILLFGNGWLHLCVFKF